MRLVAALLMVGWFGCLPPPRPWVDAGPSGPPVPPGDESAGSVDDSDPEDTGVDDPGGTDTGAIPLQCHALAFEEDGHVVVKHTDLNVDSLFDEDSVTIELWAWFSDQTRDGSWLLAGLEGNRTWMLRVEGGELVLHADVYSLSIPLPSNGWNHIAGVIDGSNREMLLYVNGVVSGRREWFPPMVNSSDNPAIHFGAWNTDDGSWPSAIDEVRFANSVLVDGDNIETGPERPVEPWLGVWRFDNDLENAVSGQASEGSDIRFTDSCP